ncbi:nucleolar protein 12 family protein [Rhodotorula toruloides]|uniref:Nucleolar protein 12 family protein n=1 Tax=Rhodotorula toruloides TaxID=5286 RepID=A0A511KIX9_RHOTO|nr:nucleolar protein 12 family protein [Rhodotorula toruloides]
MAPSRPSSAKKGKGKAVKLDENGRPPKIKRVKEVVFDADSRKEYLTGFSKRKKAKQTARRNKAIEREKEALRDMRRQASLFYSSERQNADEDEEDEEDFGTDSDASNDEEGSDEEGPAAAYETPDAMTTVVVESLSLSRSPTPEPLPSAPLASFASTSASQPSSLYKKRVKNAVQARPKLTRQEKKDRATGGKKTKKKMASKMKGTKGRANK